MRARPGPHSFSPCLDFSATATYLGGAAGRFAPQNFKKYDSLNQIWRDDT
jgi:hypothetical protein